MRRIGLGLALLMLVALIVAYLFSARMKPAATTASTTGQEAVQQARELVDQIHSRMDDLNLDQ